VSSGSHRPIARTVASAALLIAAVTVLARLLGFARVIVFARTVGPSCLGDTYYTANTLPNIVFDIVAGGALSSLVVPVLAGPVAAGDRVGVDRITSALLTWGASILVPVAIVGAFLVHPMMRLLVGNGRPGCSAAAEVAVGSRMLLVFMPQVVLYGLAVILVGVLQAHRRFLGPAFGPLLSSLVVASTYGVFAAVSSRRETDLSTLTRGHELVLSVGTTLGVLMLALPLLLPTARTGVRLRPTYRFPPGVASTVRRMAVSGALVLGSQDLASAVVIRLANGRGSAGAVVLYNLAWTVFVLPWAVLAVPLATSAFPAMTASWQRQDMQRYAATTASGARVLVVVVAGAAAVLAAAAGPASRVVVLGAPGGAAPAVLARSLVAFAPGLVGYALMALLSRALYAQGNARTPAIATASGWAIAIVVDIVLVAAVSPAWTVAAVGVGSSVGLTISAGWMLLALARSAGRDALAGLRRAAAAAVAGVVCAVTAGGLLAGALQGRGVAHNLVAIAVVALLAVGLHLAVVTALDRPTMALLASRGPWRRA
jgi:putative peptidoglycan lipid II flippase